MWSDMCDVLGKKDTELCYRSLLYHVVYKALYERVMDVSR